ncbi:MAG: 1-(5-phosphoribosyl)-5-[(5-phosphoribosylamino)methylideneamino]imidazole-4-carboxamide isomerase [bacterium]|nr:1-(5-phosphoribosyl)-5-[(5-phosphoribosylamino)methylideneamino]imidazole-4-carboxamide isomerase [bacterium]
MLIIPAIDLMEGKVVRLSQGRFSEKVVYSDEPVRVAKKWKEKGVELLHVIDLDGARTGSPQNLDIVRGIISQVKIPIQLGGGIRDIEMIEDVLSTGVARVILGTKAITDPSFVKEACSRFKEKILVGVDSKEGKIAIHGWTKTIDQDIFSVVSKLKELGVARIIFTDISRDGVLRGPDIETITKILQRLVNIEVIYSGGISSLEDIKRLNPLEKHGLKGVIIGKALYTGSIDLEEAIRICNPHTSE